MRISRTLLVLVLALIIMVIDYQFSLGIVAFLSDYFVVLIVLALVFTTLGIRGIKV